MRSVVLFADSCSATESDAVIILFGQQSIIGLLMLEHEMYFGSAGFVSFFNPESNQSVGSFKRFFSFHLLTLVLLPALCAVPASAQSARVWQMTGPFGGDVSSLAVDPRNSNHLILGTHDGQIYQSANGGLAWRLTAPGLKLNGFEIRRFLFDRERAGVIYAGLVQIKDARDDSSGGGIYRSTDNGETWSEIEIMNGRSVRGIVQSASDPNVIIVAARDGIYRTSDRGENWERLTPEADPELRGFHSAAIDPRDAKIIYVGTWHLPWKTVDGGLTWKRAGSKESGMIDDSDIFAIQIDESKPDSVLMSACSGIYRSFDASAKWTKLQGIPYTSRRTHVIYQHPTRPEVIFAGTTEGLWRTTDGGKNWEVKTSPRLIINAISIHPDKPDCVFVGTEDMGVMISNDGGENYVSSNTGFISRQVRVVLPDRTQPGRIYAGVIFDGVGGGLFISEDSGMTWQQSIKGMGVSDIYSLYQDGARPETIYAGTNHGMFRTDDRGSNWVAVKKAESNSKAIPGNRGPVRTPSAGSGSQPPAKKSATSTIRPPSQTSASTSQVKPVVQTRPHSTASESRRLSPAGGNNQPTATPAKILAADLQSQVFGIAPLAPFNETRSGLVAATWDGLYRTDDEKKGWQPLFPLTDSTSDTGRSNRPMVRAVATSPHAPGLILAGTEQGLFISHDNGDKFLPLPLDSEPHRIQIIVFDPRNAEMIYVGAADGFFRSTNGGQSWERRGGGLRLASSVSAITINPSNPDEVYLADYNRGGFYHSVDRGRNWEGLMIGDLPSQRLLVLASDPTDGSRMYIGSFSGGVYVVTRQAGLK